jgi:hypothetical protein
MKKHDPKTNVYMGMSTFAPKVSAKWRNRRKNSVRSKVEKTTNSHAAPIISTTRDGDVDKNKLREMVQHEIHFNYLKLKKATSCKGDRELSNPGCRAEV